MLTSDQCRVVAYWTEDGLAHPDATDDHRSPVIAYTASEYRAEDDDRTVRAVQLDRDQTVYLIVDGNGELVDGDPAFTSEGAAWDHIYETRPPLTCCYTGKEIDA